MFCSIINVYNIMCTVYVRTGLHVLILLLSAVVYIMHTHYYIEFCCNNIAA